MLGTLNRILSMLLISATVTVLTGGCHRKHVPVPQDDVVIVAYGDTSLTLREVVHRIPRGLEHDDSVEMFRSIVETWLRRQVLTEFASRNIPDMDEIDRLVDQYRSDLILGRYLARVDQGAKPNISNRRVDRYLSQRADSMTLEEPVVKGIFLKVSEDDPNLETLLRWMRTSTDYSVDKLEHNILRGATQYEYFMDRWHPWHEVADLVPYRFFDADAFLEANKDFETRYGGSVYIIHISDYVGSGMAMPLEYAREQIREALRQEDIAVRRQDMIRDIYRHEMSEGRLKEGLYNPGTGKLGNDDKEN